MPAIDPEQAKIMDACARGERGCRIIVVGNQIIDVKPGGLELINEHSFRVDFEGFPFVITSSAFVRAEELPDSEP